MVKKICIEIPEDIHKKFRMHCINQGTTMKDLIVGDWIPSWIEEMMEQGKKAKQVASNTGIQEVGNKVNGSSVVANTQVAK